MESYRQKKNLARLIVQEIKSNYDMFDYFGDAQHRTSVVYGILEDDIKIEEIPEGFSITVPGEYGEEYVKECIEQATEKWLLSLKLEGKVSEE